MAAIAWRESPAVRSAGQSDGRRSQSHQRNWVAKSRDEHAGCKEWRREGKYPSARTSLIVGMASAKKGQQARSEMGYPRHVDHPGRRPTNSVTMNPPGGIMRGFMIGS